MDRVAAISGVLEQVRGRDGLGVDRTPPLDFVDFIHSFPDSDTAL